MVTTFVSCLFSLCKEEREKSGEKSAFSLPPFLGFALAGLIYGVNFIIQASPMDLRQILPLGTLAVRKMGRPLYS